MGSLPLQRPENKIITKLDNETKVIAILSGYVRELSEGNDFLETTYQTAKTIVKICSPDDVQRSIAVISLDTQDFKLWSFEYELIYEGFEQQRKIKVGNTTYYCISKVCDLCSLSINEILETKHAKENKEYDEIKSVITGNLIKL